MKTQRKVIFGQLRDKKSDYIQTSLKDLWCHVMDWNKQARNKIWCFWDRASLEQRCKQPTRWQKFHLLIFFKSALHVSGDKFAHSGALCTGQQQYRCIVPKAVHTVNNRSWGWPSLSPETCRVDLKRSINGICCILMVAYIAVRKKSNNTLSRTQSWILFFKKLGFNLHV